MKQNITLRIDKDLLKKSKILATQKGISISNMLSSLLKEIVDRDAEYEAAKKKALQNMKKGYHLGGNITWKRENLYE
jgi:antitoxin component of RelBE/YafQ-DinJ toxin-antitoxin module